jgi:hypothetical protein
MPGLKNARIDFSIKRYRLIAVAVALFEIKSF